MQIKLIVALFMYIHVMTTLYYQIISTSGLDATCQLLLQMYNLLFRKSWV